MSDTQALALQMLGRGLSVIPVPLPGGRFDGKVPVIAWREFQERRATEVELRAWFSTPVNIAIVTGAVSGCVVIDADSPEALTWIRRRLPYTPWQTKTSKGFHLWYRHPGSRVGNRARIDTGDGRLALDVRGDGGYVIGPGSIHATGAVYEFAGDWSVSREALPRFWPGWLARPERQAASSQHRPRPTGHVVERARRYLARIPQPEIGSGSDAATLYVAARLVRGFDIPESDAIDLLVEWAGHRPGWTREWIARKVHSAAKYGTEPIGAFR